MNFRKSKDAEIVCPPEDEKPMFSEIAEGREERSNARRVTREAKQQKIREQCGPSEAVKEQSEKLNSSYNLMCEELSKILSPTVKEDEEERGKVIPLHA